MTTVDVFGDIETIRTQRADVIDWIAKGLPPAETFEENEAALEKAVDATALDGALGEIVCIGMATGDNEPKTWHRGLDGSERDLLIQFREAFVKLGDLTAMRGGKLRLIGHNFLDFDRNFIRKRFIVHGLKAPWQFTCEIKPWERDVVMDTMHMWSNGEKRGFVSLDKLALALGLPGKGDVDGSMVWDLIKAGKADEVAAYCADDVRKTRAVFRRLTNLE